MPGLPYRLVAAAGLTLVLALSMAACPSQHWTPILTEGCPSVDRPATQDESYYAILVALLERKYTIHAYSLKDHTVTAQYRKGYRGGTYNVTWSISVGPDGLVTMDTVRDEHSAKQMKQVRGWHTRLEQSFVQHRCRSVDDLRVRVGRAGTIRL